MLTVHIFAMFKEINTYELTYLIKSFHIKKKKKQLTGHKIKQYQGKEKKNLSTMVTDI